MTTSDYSPDLEQRAGRIVRQGNENEKELIEKNDPLSQSGISDRQKCIEDKIHALNQFINSH